MHQISFKYRHTGDRGRPKIAQLLGGSFRFLFALIITLSLSIGLAACGVELQIYPGQIQTTQGSEHMDVAADVVYGADYLDMEEVLDYLVLFEELPPNYLSKQEAYDLGWEPSEGNLWDVAYGSAIGGDRFGNREGLLPDDTNRRWYEADVNYEGGYRGGERLVYSDDGYIYYTQDHYESFELYQTAGGQSD